MNPMRLMLPAWQAEALLDRGWGKPRQSHEAEITHRYVIEIPALMDNATWEAEALEHEPDKLQAR